VALEAVAVEDGPPVEALDALEARQIALAGGLAVEREGRPVRQERLAAVLAVVLDRARHETTGLRSELAGDSAQ
jgi:hypothetical protein